MQLKLLLLSLVGAGTVVGVAHRGDLLSSSGFKISELSNKMISANLPISLAEKRLLTDVMVGDIDRLARFFNKRSADDLLFQWGKGIFLNYREGVKENSSISPVEKTVFKIFEKHFQFASSPDNDPLTMEYRQKTDRTRGLGHITPRFWNREYLLRDAVATDLKNAFIDWLLASPTSEKNDSKIKKLHDSFLKSWKESELIFYGKKWDFPYKKTFKSAKEDEKKPKQKTSDVASFKKPVIDREGAWKNLCQIFNPSETKTTEQSTSSNDESKTKGEELFFSIKDAADSTKVLLSSGLLMAGYEKVGNSTKSAESSSTKASATSSPDCAKPMSFFSMKDLEVQAGTSSESSEQSTNGSTKSPLFVEKNGYHLFRHETGITVVKGNWSQGTPTTVEESGKKANTKQTSANQASQTDNSDDELMKLMKNKKTPSGFRDFIDGNLGYLLFEHDETESILSITEINKFKFNQALAKNLWIYRKFLNTRILFRALSQSVNLHNVTFFSMEESKRKEEGIGYSSIDVHFPESTNSSETSTAETPLGYKELLWKYEGRLSEKIESTYPKIEGLVEATSNFFDLKKVRDEKYYISGWWMWDLILDNIIRSQEKILKHQSIFGMGHHIASLLKDDDQTNEKIVKAIFGENSPITKDIVDYFWASKYLSLKPDDAMSFGKTGSTKETLAKRIQAFAKSSRHLIPLRISNVQNLDSSSFISYLLTLKDLMDNKGVTKAIQTITKDSVNALVWSSQQQKTTTEASRVKRDASTNDPSTQTKPFQSLFNSRIDRFFVTDDSKKSPSTSTSDENLEPISFHSYLCVDVKENKDSTSTPFITALKKTSSEFVTSTQSTGDASSGPKEDVCGFAGIFNGTNGNDLVPKTISTSIKKLDTSFNFRSYEKNQKLDADFFKSIKKTGYLDRVLTVFPELKKTLFATLEKMSIVDYPADWQTRLTTAVETENGKQNNGDSNQASSSGKTDNNFIKIQNETPKEQSGKQTTTTPDFLIKTEDEKGGHYAFIRPLLFGDMVNDDKLKEALGEKIYNLLLMHLALNPEVREEFSRSFLFGTAQDKVRLEDDRIKSRSMMSFA